MGKSPEKRMKNMTQSASRLNESFVSIAFCLRPQKSDLYQTINLSSSETLPLILLIVNGV